MISKKEKRAILNMIELQSNTGTVSTMASVYAVAHVLFEIGELDVWEEINDMIPDEFLFEVKKEAWELYIASINNR